MSYNKITVDVADFVKSLSDSVSTPPANYFSSYDCAASDPAKRSRCTWGFILREQERQGKLKSVLVLRAGKKIKYYGKV